MIDEFARKPLALFFVSGLLAATTVLASCKDGEAANSGSESSEQTADEPAQASENAITLSSPADRWPKELKADVPAEVKKYIFVDRMPLAVTYRPSRWSELGTAARNGYETLAIPEEAQKIVAPVVEPFLDEGVIAGIGRLLGDDDPLAALNRERAIWATTFSVGTEDLFRAYRYGLGEVPRRDAPVAFATRLLWPTDSPEKLAEQLRAWADRIWGDEPLELQTSEKVAPILKMTAEQFTGSQWRIDVTPGEQFVRTTLVRLREDLEDSEKKKAAREAFETTGDSDAPLDAPTPALTGFADAEAPLAAYVDTARLRDHRAAHFASSTVEVLQRVERQGIKPRIMAKAVSTLLNLGLYAGDSTREYRDHAFALRGDGHEGLAADWLGSYTKVGSQIAEVADASIQLPRFSANGLPAKSAVADLRWAHDLQAVAEKLAVEFETGESDPEGASSIRDTWGSGTGAARLLEFGGQIAVGLHNPHIPVRMVGQKWGLGSLLLHAFWPLDQSENLPLPLAGRLRVAPVDNDKGQANADPEKASVFRGAAVLLMPDVDAKTRKSLENLLADWKKDSPFVVIKRDKKPTVDFRITKRDSGRLEVRIAQNIALDEAFSEQSGEVSALDASIQPGKITETVMQMAPSRARKRFPLDIQKLRKLGHLQARATATPTSSYVQLHWGPKSTGGMAIPDYAYEPEATAPRCLDGLKARARAAWASLDEVHPDATLDFADTFLEAYDTAIEACRPELPEDSDNAAFARGRARTWMARLIDMRNGKRDAISRSCDRGNEHACDFLKNHSREFFERKRQTVADLYAKACELGDPVGCRADDKEQ